MLRLGKAIIAKYNKKYDQIMKFALNFLKFFLHFVCIYRGIVQKVGWVATHFLA